MERWEVKQPVGRLGPAETYHCPQWAKLHREAKVPPRAAPAGGTTEYPPWATHTE